MSALSDHRIIFRSKVKLVTVSFDMRKLSQCHDWHGQTNRQTDMVLFRLQVSVFTCYQYFLPFCDRAVDIDVSLACPG